MERERLTRLLEEPGLVAREDLAGLRDLAGRHPWFAGAQLLKTLGEQASGEVLMDDGLRTAAAHLPTRAMLFDAVHAAKPATQEIAPALPPPAPSSVEMDDAASMLEVVHQETPDAVPDREAVAPVTVPEPPSGPGEAPGTPPAGTEAPADPLDMEIRRAALASSYELLLEHTEEAPVVTAGKVEEEPDVIPAVEATLPEEPAFMPQEPATAAPPPRPAVGRRRFTDWLAGAPAAESTAAEAPALPPAPAPEAPAAPPSEDPVEPLATTMQEKPSTDVGTLIDRFIQQQTPPQQPPKATFFTPQQAGKRSLEDTSDLVTETLAGIYAKQGNLAKARDAYRRLALKYPEKSAYFAALSQKLEDRTSN